MKNKCLMIFAVAFCILGFTAPTKAMAADDAQFISQDVPSAMTPGQSYSVSITMKNTGTTTWTKAKNYRLGSQNPQNNTTWGIKRVLLFSSDSIAPGQTKTFTFSVKAPATGGTYNFQWRMIRGAKWFGSYTTNLAINVQGLDTIPPESPTNAKIKVVSSTEILLTWDASTDNVAVAGYLIFRNGVYRAWTTKLFFSDTDVAPNTPYTYTLEAVDTSGNISIPIVFPVVTIKEDLISYPVIIDEYDQLLPTQGEYYNYTGGDRGIIKEGDVEYTWDNGSMYTATIVHKDSDEEWTYGGMWYSLIGPNKDNSDAPRDNTLDFKAIFGPYVNPEYQGEITEVELMVNNVSSAKGNDKLFLAIELKDKNDSVIVEQHYTDLISQAYPKKFVFVIPDEYKKEVKFVNWIIDKAQVGDSITVESLGLTAKIPSKTKIPTKEQAFIWTYSWLMSCYNPLTGMVQDRSSFGTGDFENVTATGKTAKVVYYAYKKGYTTLDNAKTVITQIADTFINKLPRGPSGKNSLWPHFTSKGGTVAIPPHVDENGKSYEGTEWASGDTAYAALDVITALQLIGDTSERSQQLQSILNSINWNALILPDGGISHGYKYNGEQIPYSWQSFGMETSGVLWAYASCTGNMLYMSAPPTYNGSGFIDNAQYPMVLSGKDAWDNDWDNYRNSAADTQIDWYDAQGRNSYLYNTGLFGLSAAEIPEGEDYAAYGVGGEAPANDGNGEVFVLHYPGMISDIKLTEATRMWETLLERNLDFLQNTIIISPLNNMESMRVNKTTGKLTINHLKGSWNLALQAEGWALNDTTLREDLYNAIQNNPFLKKGYDLLKTPYTPPNVLKVPQQYPTIQAAIDAAVSGNTILVSAGTYNESITFNKSGVTLKGESQSDNIFIGLPTIIIGLPGLPAITCSDLSGETKAKIINFTINAGDGNYHAIRCMGTASSLDIENNYLPISGVYLEDGASAIIQNNEIDNCFGVISTGHNNVQIIGNRFLNTLGPNPPGIRLVSTNGLIKDNYFSQRWSGALTISDGSNVDIINNKIDNCYGWDAPAGIIIQDSTAVLQNNLITNLYICSRTISGVGLDADNSTVFLYNNIFAGIDGLDNTVRGLAVNAYNTNLVAKNNIFCNNKNGQETVYFAGTGTLDFSYNDIWNNATGQDTTGVTFGPGNIALDPLFVGSQDFHLSTGSPCINAGDPDAQFNDLDGTRNDMGAYGGPSAM